MHNTSMITKIKDMAYWEYIVLTGLLMAQVAYSTNTMLPAFPEMVQDLGLTQANNIQLTVSLFYFGMAFGQLLFGPLSDRLGRKPSIMTGLTLYILGCLVSFQAESLQVLLMGRFIQGLGLGAPRTVTVAMVRDRYQGGEMARVMSYILVVFVLLPMPAPALGQGLLEFYSWRAAFLFMSGLGLLTLLWFYVRQPETLAKSKRKHFTPGLVLRSAREILTNRTSLGYTLITGLVSSSFVAYLSLSQQIFQDSYGLGNGYFIYFACLTLMIGLGMFLNGRLVLRFGMKFMVKRALMVLTLVAILTTSLALLSGGHPPLVLLLIAMGSILLSYGILIGNMNALALAPLGHIAGMGAALVGSLSTFISVPLAILIGRFYNGSVLPLTGGFAFFGLLALGIYYWINSKQVANVNKKTPLSVEAA